MDGVRISKQYVASIKPTGKDEFHWDRSLPGFGLRVQRSGASSYVVKYRPASAAGFRGRQVLPKRITLGSTAKLTPDYARTLAKKLLGKVANGADPAKERREAARKAETATTTTLKAVAETYLSLACGMRRNEDGRATFSPNARLRSADQRVKVFERLVYPNEISKRQIGEIGRGDIAKLLGKIEATRGPRMAHVTLAYLSALFNWYAARHDSFRTPIVRGMSPIKPAERAGNRILDDREIRDIWAVLDKVEIPPCFARLLRTLLLTGLRRNQAARATWFEIDYLRRDDYQGDVLTIPAARMKGKLDHAVPLTQRLLALLGERAKIADVRASPFVFSLNGGGKAFRNFASAKATLDAEIYKLREADGREPMPRWVLHDLRRTAKTLMQRAGVRPDISERVLAHAIKGVEGVYDRYGYLPEKMDALTKLDTLVERILKTIDW
jgi:integrase